MGSGLGSTPRSGMGGGFMEPGGLGAFAGGLGTGALGGALSGQLSRQLSSADGLGAWDLGGAGASQARTAGKTTRKKTCLTVCKLCSGSAFPWRLLHAVSGVFRDASRVVT